jgi:isopenicillin N synthase-like dioxygenase
LIDVSPALGAGPDRRRVGDALVAALEKIGFAYVVGHGVPQATIDAAFAASKAFHALPVEAKLAIRQNAFHRGYMPFSSSTIVTSTVAQVRKPNQSESFMMMHELAPDDPDIGKPLQGPNQWPAELPDFKPMCSPTTRRCAT